MPAMLPAIAAALLLQSGTAQSSSLGHANGEAVLLARGQDGVLRAMSNVCRHNAAIVEPAAQGNAANFRCRYHGWTYGCDGSLRGD